MWIQEEINAIDEEHEDQQLRARNPKCFRGPKGPVVVEDKVVDGNAITKAF